MENCAKVDSRVSGGEVPPKTVPALFGLPRFPNGPRSLRFFNSRTPGLRHWES